MRTLSAVCRRNMVHFCALEIVWNENIVSEFVDDEYTLTNNSAITIVIFFKQ